MTFKVPGVPLVPAAAVFVNIYLMMKLSLATWVRFFIWLLIGLMIYFFYGLKHSSENVLATSPPPLTPSPSPSATKEDSIEKRESYGSTENITTAPPPPRLSDF